MKPAWIVAAFAITVSAAQAGPNAGGVLDVHDAGLAYSAGISSYCGLGNVPATCPEIDARLDGSGSEPRVWKVYAAFPPSSHPRLKHTCFGIDYDASAVFVIASGNCGNNEWPGDGWPAPGSGNSLYWNVTQTAHLVELYWFAGYNYSGLAQVFRTRPHPEGAGDFIDDSLPGILEPIAGYGVLGLDGPGVPGCDPMAACCFADGSCQTLHAEDCIAQGGSFRLAGCSPYEPCPTDLGACCRSDGACYLLSPNGCAWMGGDWQGVGVSCAPDPCGTSTVPEEGPLPGEPRESTWGRIKSTYRR